MMLLTSIGLIITIQSALFMSTNGTICGIGLGVGCSMLGMVVQNFYDKLGGKR